MSTDTPPVTVIALIRAQAGAEDRLRALLLPVVAPTRREVGCLNYDLHESADRPGSFAFHENWRSQADLERHLASPHITSARAQLPPLVAEEPQITLWYKLA